MENEWKEVPVSQKSMRTSNPIRNIVDKLVPPKNPHKPIIHLSIGDPTRCASLCVPESAMKSIPEQLKEAKYNGYGPSTGFDSAKEAIAKKFSTKESPLQKDDVIIGSGCSHALDMAISAIVEEKCNLLIPSPGFSLYQTLCQYHNIEFKHYELDPNKNWEIKLDHLESLIDEKTRAILINNPSNPCGSNFSQQHLESILKLALKHKLPIISDEIYADMVFTSEKEERKFIPISSISQDVPILTCGGIAKRYMIPGWRLGWILIDDKKNRFEKVREALRRLSTTILGACSLIQSSIPSLLFNTSSSYLENSVSFLHKNAQIVEEKLKNNKALTIIPPQAAMYMMIGINISLLKDIKDDFEFSQLLLNEEIVSILPGTCFNYPNFFRIVLCVEKKELEEAVDRISSFCNRHLKN